MNSEEVQNGIQHDGHAKHVNGATGEDEDLDTRLPNAPLSAEERHRIAEAKKEEKRAALAKHHIWKRLTMPTREIPPCEHRQQLREKGQGSKHQKRTSIASVLPALLTMDKKLISERLEFAVGRRDPNWVWPVYRRLTLAKRRRAEEEKRWDPNADVKIQGDPKCTVIVARLAPSATEEDLRAFGRQFGSVREDGVRVVRRKAITAESGAKGQSSAGRNRSRGYGFIIFNRPEEARKAKEEGNGSLMLGKAVVVDMERARRQPRFRPLRLRDPSRRKKAGDDDDGGGDRPGKKRPRT